MRLVESGSSAFVASWPIAGGQSFPSRHSASVLIGYFQCDANVRNGRTDDDRSDFVKVPSSAICEARHKADDATVP